MADVQSLKTELQFLQSELANAQDPSRIEYLKKRIKEIKIQLFQIGGNFQ